MIALTLKMLGNRMSKNLQPVPAVFSNDLKQRCCKSFKIPEANTAIYWQTLGLI